MLAHLKGRERRGDQGTNRNYVGGRLEGVIVFLG